MRESFRDSRQYPAEKASEVFASIRAGKHRGETRQYHRVGDAHWVSREPAPGPNNQPGGQAQTK